MFVVSWALGILFKGKGWRTHAEASVKKWNKKGDRDLICLEVVSESVNRAICYLRTTDKKNAGATDYHRVRRDLESEEIIVRTVRNSSADPKQIRRHRSRKPRGKPRSALNAIDQLICNQVSLQTSQEYIHIHDHSSKYIYTIEQ
jgi:hypothetical protein